MPLIAIWAESQNSIIGNGNQLPCHIPSELKHFKRLTTGHSVVMGYRTITYQSPKDAMYGLRFIFDNDWSTLTITGDSLNAIFTNCNNMGSPDRLY